MPYSKSIPHSTLLDPDTGAFLPQSQLRQVFEEMGVNTDTRIISSCGTGVTAAVVDTALEEAGFRQDLRQIYDGSWTEWAQRVGPGENLILKDGA